MCGKESNFELRYAVISGHQLSILFLLILIVRAYPTKFNMECHIPKCPGKLVLLFGLGPGVKFKSADVKFCENVFPHGNWVFFKYSIVSLIGIKFWGFGN